MNNLRIRASRENADLGPPPANPRQHELWSEQRRQAVLLLAKLADHDAELLRRTATGEWVTPAARDLLLDAAQEC